MNMEKYTIPLDKLKKVCDYENELDFHGSSLEAPQFEGVIGQDRAVSAMEFGLRMNAAGYNIFVVGPHGTGKSTYTQTIVAKIAQNGKIPQDWCYINNFSDEDRPYVVSFPAGLGKVFKKDMDNLIVELRSSISKAFDESDYEERRDKIISDLQSKLDEMYRNIRNEASKSGFSMRQVPPRYIFYPVKNGMQLPQEEYDRLSPEEKKDLDEKGRRLTKMLDESLRESQKLDDDAKKEMRKLENEIALTAALPKVTMLKIKYADYPRIVEYFQEALDDIVEHHKAFRVVESSEEKVSIPFQQAEPDPITRYNVNVFVNNESCTGAPVVIEPNPNYYNLFGKLEYNSQMLSISTDFTMIRPGSIHRANGGFLIIQAKDILSDPFAWETLKKALKYRKALVENIGEQYRLVPAGTIRPEPVPLDIKVIIICDPELYYLLYSLDEDVQRLFKVRVDFDVDMPRTRENLHQYASFISSLCTKEKLLHFNQAALGKVIELGSRIAGDQNKLSTRFNKMTEVIYEAAAQAELDHADLVDAIHVERAIKEKKKRDDRLEERIHEEIFKKRILINTEGVETGQINGLSVLGSGGYAFGLPTRITARTFAGTEGIINIERETQMSGSIHTKGVLTLSGYIGGKFAQSRPLGLTAQVTFEQSYGGVEGDSASSAELYAILSSLADAPINQSIAVTGSVDQRGDIQPIGGATEKIEGFFDICSMRGLTGKQGVIIPIQNIDNLMLKDEVLEAVKEGKFHLYAVERIEEGIEILTGVPAGELNEDGVYPEGSIFQRVDQKLKSFSIALKNSFSRNKSVIHPNAAPIQDENPEW